MIILVQGYQVWIKLFRILILTFFLLPSFLFSQEQTLSLQLQEQERIILRKHMINYDLYIRNLISYTTIEYVNNTQKMFKRLSEISKSKSLSSVKLKMKKKNVWRYILQIEQSSQKVLNYMKGKKSKDIDWSFVQKGLLDTTRDCRGCHLRVSY